MPSEFSSVLHTRSAFFLRWLRFNTRRDANRPWGTTDLQLRRRVPDAGSTSRSFLRPPMLRYRGTPVRLPHAREISKKPTYKRSSKPLQRLRYSPEPRSTARCWRCGSPDHSLLNSRPCSWAAQDGDFLYPLRCSSYAASSRCGSGSAEAKGHRVTGRNS